MKFKWLIICMLAVACGRAKNNKTQDAPGDDPTGPELRANEVANGGKGIFCAKKGVEVLDFYEARALRGINGDAFSGSRDDILGTVIERLAKKDKERADRYQKRASEFWAEAKLLGNVKLTGVDDSKHTVIPESCRVVQIALQVKRRFTEDKKFLIDEKLWKQMNEVNQAGLILHEIIYEEAIETGQANSVATRYFNSILFSRPFPAFDSHTYTVMADESELNTFKRINDQIIYLSGAEHAANGELISGRVVYPAKLSLNGLTLPLAKNAKMTFHENGGVAELVFAEDSEVAALDGTTRKVQAGEAMRFDEVGRLIP